MAPEIKQDTSEPKDGLFFPGKPGPNQVVKTDHSRDQQFSSVHTFGQKDPPKTTFQKNADVKKSTDRKSSSNLDDNYDDDFEEYDVEESVRQSMIKDPSPATAKDRFSAAAKDFEINKKSSSNIGGSKVEEEISIDSGFQDTYDDNDDLF